MEQDLQGGAVGIDHRLLSSHPGRQTVPKYCITVYMYYDQLICKYLSMLLLHNYIIEITRTILYNMLNGTCIKKLKHLETIKLIN